MLPKVDTFTHNIADEIRRKEASLEEISETSKSKAERQPLVPKKNYTFLIVLAVLFVVCGILLAGVAYFFFPSSPKVQPGVVIQQYTPLVDSEKITADLAKISPTLATQIGRFVTKIDKRDTGYILTISAYSPVFAYMARNENAYIQELASLFPETKTATTTPPKIVIEKKEVMIATSTATTSPTKVTTKKTATSTKSITTKSLATTTTEELPVIEAPTASYSPYKDITVANQNMRIWTSINHTVVYAFITDKEVIISDTPERVLTLKDGILR